LTAAIYLRKSRAEEEIEDALQRHRETLLDFAKKNDISITRIYEEVVSGENLYMRPQMLQLLEDVERGTYDSILCMDIDRLGRGNMASQGVILDTFKTAACKIITPRRIYDLNNELDEEYTEFESFMARREYKIITRRMRRGIVKSVESGGHIGEVPFGYKRAFNGKLPTLEIDEEKAPYVRMAFDMYVNRGVGCQIIANAFTSAGLKPKKTDSIWGRTTIRRILRNPVYTGVIAWNRYRNVRKRNPSDTNKQVLNEKSEWIVIKDAHPAIIDKKLFEGAQEIMRSHSHSSYFTGEFVNPLAGLIYCSECGKLLQRQHQISKEKYPRLFCRTKGCSSGIRLEFVETAIIDALKGSLTELEPKINNQAAKDNSAVIQTYQSELSKIKTQRNNLYDLLEQGVYTIDIFTERSNALAIREKNIGETIATLQSDPVPVDLKELSEKIKYTIDHYFLTDDPNLRNMLLKSVIEKVIYTRKKDYPYRTFDISLEIKGI